MKSSFFPCVLLLSVHSVFAQQPGDLDLTFSGDGIVATDIGLNSNDFVGAMALQADGRIVVVGRSEGAFALARYMPDGSLDPGFGTGGIVTTEVGPFLDQLQAVALQPDGRIVVAGRSSVDGSENQWVIGRYTGDGQLDASFAGDGILLVDVGTGTFDEANSIAVQADGSIVTAGMARSATDDDIAVVRCTANGALDPSFSGDGKLILGYGTNDDSAGAVLVQSDGKILVAGYTGNGQEGDFAVARLTSGGLPDTSFGTNGSTITSFGGNSYDMAYALALQPDGKIIAGGAAHSIPNWPLTDMALQRLTTNGVLDPGFDDDGLYLVPYLGVSAVVSLAIMPDGRIVIGGTSDDAFMVAMVEANGGMDVGFGNDGVRTIAPGQFTAYGSTVVVQPDGKILLAGDTHMGTTLDDLVVLRFLTDMNIGVAELSGRGTGTLLYPNPIGSRATIAFSLEQAERVSIVLIDNEGRTVRVLRQEALIPAGSHRFDLDLSGAIVCGSYVIRLASAKGGEVNMPVVKE